jgi:hypothetical protein
MRTEASSSSLVLWTLKWITLTRVEGRGRKEDKQVNVQETPKGQHPNFHSRCWGLIFIAQQKWFDLLLSSGKQHFSKVTKRQDSAVNGLHCAQRRGAGMLHSLCMHWGPRMRPEWNQPWSLSSVSPQVQDHLQLSEHTVYTQTCVPLPVWTAQSLVSFPPTLEEYVRSHLFHKAFLSSLPN